MPAKNPRINLVIEEPLYRIIFQLARKDKVSISQKTRDLIRDALELIEDIGLEHIADERMKNYDAKKVISHEKLKKRLRIK